MKTILLVEDEETVNDTITDMLTIEKYKVLQAFNGLQALELLNNNQNNIDLILSDINMPEMDGYELLSNVKANEKTKFIPFIFLTAKVEKKDLRKGMELGADDYLFKPFSHNELLKALETRFNILQNNKLETEKKLDSLRFQLTSTLPHEFRTPLNVIMATSQFLERKVDVMKKDEVKDMVNNIISAGGRLSKLISNYLVYTKLILNETDSVTNKAFINITPEAGEMIENIAFNVADDYDRINDLNIDLDDSTINIYPEYFLKLCEELITNAFKFSKDNTPIRISGKNDGDNYILKIEDEGIGFDPKYIKEIGGFIQFDRNIIEQQGMGLGLAITKLICEKFNLEIDINSELDKFTKVVVKIPLVKDIS